MAPATPSRPRANSDPYDIPRTTMIRGLLMVLKYREYMLKSNVEQVVSDLCELIAEVDASSNPGIQDALLRYFAEQDPLKKEYDELIASCSTVLTAASSGSSWADVPEHMRAGTILPPRQEHEQPPQSGVNNISGGGPATTSRNAYNADAGTGNLVQIPDGTVSQIVGDNVIVHRTNRGYNLLAGIGGAVGPLSIDPTLSPVNPELSFDNMLPPILRRRQNANFKYYPEKQSRFGSYLNVYKPFITEYPKPGEFSRSNSPVYFTKPVPQQLRSRVIWRNAKIGQAEEIWQWMKLHDDLLEKHFVARARQLENGDIWDTSSMLAETVAKYLLEDYERNYGKPNWATDEDEIIKFLNTRDTWYTKTWKDNNPGVWNCEKYVREYNVTVRSGSGGAEVRRYPRHIVTTGEFPSAIAGRYFEIELSLWDPHQSFSRLQEYTTFVLNPDIPWLQWSERRGAFVGFVPLDVAARLDADENISSRENPDGFTLDIYIHARTIEPLFQEVMYETQLEAKISVLIEEENGEGNSEDEEEDLLPGKRLKIESLKDFRLSYDGTNDSSDNNPLPSYSLQKEPSPVDPGYEASSSDNEEELSEGDDIDEPQQKKSEVPIRNETRSSLIFPVLDASGATSTFKSEGTASSQGASPKILGLSSPGRYRSTPLTGNEDDEKYLNSPRRNSHIRKASIETNPWPNEDDEKYLDFMQRKSHIRRASFESNPWHNEEHEKYLDSTQRNIRRASVETNPWPNEEHEDYYDKVIRWEEKVTSDKSPKSSGNLDESGNASPGFVSGAEQQTGATSEVSGSEVDFSEMDDILLGRESMNREHVTKSATEPCSGSSEKKPQLRRKRSSAILGEEGFVSDGTLNWDSADSINSDKSKGKKDKGKGKEREEDS
ncbi:hypothetical protein RUND412_007744 [Rhizina undulata]